MLQSWLQEIGLGKYVEVLDKENIDADLLAQLDDQELRELGFTLGHRKKLRTALAGRSQSATDPGSTVDPRGVEGAHWPDTGRRQLTVLFCDIVGSTELSFALDPEELQQITAAYQHCCETIVERFNGNIARYMGDGVLVYFGYPKADEDDPERALLAALRLSTAVPQLEFRSGVRLQTRIGIATGKVVVGQLIGHGASREHEVVGETPNLAARLQSLAAPDSILITERTRQLAGPFFDYVEHEFAEVKGVTGKLTAFEVTSQRDVEDRFAARHPQLQQGSLMGRNVEADQLWRIWQSAVNGRGEIVRVHGEAGIGKSRLIHALRDRLAMESCNLVQFQGVPYTRQTVLYPVISQLQRAAGIRRADTATRKLERIEQLVASSGADAIEVVPLYASLMSVPIGERYPPLNLGPELQRERTLSALTAQFLSNTIDRPLLMVFEDLHWMDEQTLDFIDRLQGSIADRAVMMVISYRPEFEPAFGNYALTTTDVALERLDTKEAEAIVKQVVEGRSLPEPVLQHILSKTDGVPLFVEELTKTILDSGLLIAEGDHYALARALTTHGLPDTLHDSLMARLDRLGPVKQIAQIGAVIGRHFSYELIAAVSDLSADELQSGLAAAANAELIYPSSSGTDTSYSFKHALVQDAAYSSLLRGKRKPLHEKIAQVLIDQFPLTAETEPERVARHFTEAGAMREAITYWLRAGERAGQQAAHTQAISHLRRALDLISDQPAGVDTDQLEARCQTLLGVSLAARYGYAVPAVEEAYQRARQLCERIGQTPEQFPILSGLVSFYLVRADHELSDKLAAEYVEVAESSDTPEYLIDAYRSRGFTQFFVAELESSRAALDSCTSLYARHRERRMDFLTPENPAVAALSLEPLVLWLLGYPDQALRRAEAASDLARSLGHPFNVAFTHSWSTVLHRWRGNSELSAEHAREAVRISTEYGFDTWRAVGALHLAIAMGALGDPQGGIDLFNQTAPALREFGADAFVSYHLHGLAELYVATGQLDEAVDVIEAAAEHAASHSEHFFEAGILCTRGQLLVLKKSSLAAEAAANYRRAIELARAQRSRALELRAAAQLHELCGRMGMKAGDEYALRPIYESFTEGFDTSDLLQARALLEQ